MRSIILGTDWWSDCDDAVALRVIARCAKAGKVKLLGVGINACMEHSVASLKAFLNCEGLPSVPIGIDRSATDFVGKAVYQRRLAKQFAPSLSNDDGEDAVRLYRRLLAASTEKVEILEIGFLQVVAALLQSGPDDISPKSGLALVREKVAKFWVMAGKWDNDGEKEHNFCNNARSRAAGAAFCTLCPVPVTFLGFEIGYGVITGNDLAENDVLHQVMSDHGSAKGRHSWDPMLALLALIGDEREAGYDTVKGTARVDADTGANHFTPHADGKHSYVIRQHDAAFYAEKINEIIATVSFF
jgi:hypothetical protein